MHDTIMGLLFLYAVVNGFILIETLDDNLVTGLCKTIRVMWCAGSAVGKFLVVLVSAVIIILIAPTLLINCLLDPTVNLLANISDKVLSFLFPGIKTIRIEVPMQSHEVLKILRNNDCDFIIGKDCIAFTCLRDFKEAEQYMIFLDEDIKYIT